MIKRTLFSCLIVLGVSLTAQAQDTPTKVGILHIQNALIGTKDGKKAVEELQARFKPTSDRLESMRNKLNTLQAELSKGSNTMSEERRGELARQIDQKTRTLNRATEDARSDFQADQNKILQTLGQKMMAVINKYSHDHGYSLILDVSNPQTPVLFAANGIDITQDIIKMYDKESARAAAAQAAAKPTATTAAVPAPVK